MAHRGSDEPTHASGTSTTLYKASHMLSPNERIPRTSCSLANLISEEANTLPKKVFGSRPLCWGYHLKLVSHRFDGLIYQCTNSNPMCQGG